MIIGSFGIRSLEDIFEAMSFYDACSLRVTWRE